MYSLICNFLEITTGPTEVDQHRGNRIGAVDNKRPRERGGVHDSTLFADQQVFYFVLYFYTVNFMKYSASHFTNHGC